MHEVMNDQIEHFNVPKDMVPKKVRIQPIGDSPSLMRDVVHA